MIEETSVVLLLLVVVFILSAVLRHLRVVRWDRERRDVRLTLASEKYFQRQNQERGFS